MPEPSLFGSELAGVEVLQFDSILASNIIEGFGTSGSLGIVFPAGNDGRVRESVTRGGPCLEPEPNSFGTAKRKGHG